MTGKLNRSALAAVWPPTAAIAGIAGHRPVSPMQAIRRKCLDCTGQQVIEVKLCEAVTCPLWPFRAGRHPYTSRGLLEADPAQCVQDGTPMPPKTAISRIGLQGPDFLQSEEPGPQDMVSLPHGVR